MRPGISLTKATAKVLIALILLSCLSRAHPWRHNTHKTHSGPSVTTFRSPAAYELDADFKADQVIFEPNGFAKTISIKFGNLQNKEFAFTTSTDDDGNLVAGDIDRDGDVDLIWVGSRDRNNAVVLINRGDGNFVEAADNTPYASDLDGLFDPGSSHPRSVKKHHKSSSLTSSSFSDLALDLEFRFRAPAVQPNYVATVERVAYRRALLTHVPKRGPPAILS